MNEQEQTRYADIVVLVNRTEDPQEFRHNSRVYVIPPKGKRSMPRFIAQHACEQLATSYGDNGYPSGSFLGIEKADDTGAVKEDGLFPTTPISPEEVEAINNSDKFGAEVEDGGKLITKKRVKVGGNVSKRTYQENNL